MCSLWSRRTTAYGNIGRKREKEKEEVRGASCSARAAQTRAKGHSFVEGRSAGKPGAGIRGQAKSKEEGEAAFHNDQRACRHAWGATTKTLRVAHSRTLSRRAPLAAALGVARAAGEEASTPGGGTVKQWGLEGGREERGPKTDTACWHYSPVNGMLVPCSALLPGLSRSLSRCASPHACLASSSPLTEVHRHSCRGLDQREGETGRAEGKAYSGCRSQCNPCHSRKWRWSQSPRRHPRKCR